MKPDGAASARSFERSNGWWRRRRRSGDRRRVRRLAVSVEGHIDPDGTDGGQASSCGRKKGNWQLARDTTPSAAQVLVDGKARGVSPITLSDLSAGSHEVELKSSAGTVRRTVTIAANETAALDESIFAGWGDASCRRSKS